MVTEPRVERLQNEQRWDKVSETRERKGKPSTKEHSPKPKPSTEQEEQKQNNQDEERHLNVMA